MKMLDDCKKILTAQLVVGIICALAMHVSGARAADTKSILELKATAAEMKAATDARDILPDESPNESLVKPCRILISTSVHHSVVVLFASQVKAQQAANRLKPMKGDDVLYNVRGLDCDVD